MRELVFLASADSDIQTAYERFEDIQEGRGLVFLSHLDFAFGRLRASPESGPVAFGNRRRLLVPKFPYGIFYTVESRGIVVAGVMDLRQDPKTIRKRLR